MGGYQILLVSGGCIDVGIQVSPQESLASIMNYLNSNTQL